MSSDHVDVRPNIVRTRPIPIPRGGFRTSEQEARWLEQTINMRISEGLKANGIMEFPVTVGLYDLFLVCLQEAEKRGRKAGSATNVE